jgi:hypothetical protein
VSVRRVRNDPRQNFVSDVLDKPIYSLEFFPAGGVSGDDDSGWSGYVWDCPQSMLLNFALNVREKFFPRHGSSEEERDQ